MVPPSSTRLDGRLYTLVTFVLILTALANCASASSSHSNRLDSRTTINSHLRRATSSNQVTVHHSPPARGSVWDASTGKLRGRARGLLHHRWHGVEAAQKRGLISDVVDTVSGALRIDTDDSWGVSVARAQNDHQDNEWLVTASYGTPAQQMQVVLDSGSADGYVYSPACCYASNHSAFDPARSSSFNNRTLDGKTGRQMRAPAGTPGTEWNVTYGSGRGIQGYLGLDTVSFGSNLRIENMTFALATGATGGSSSGKMEGLIGFAPSRSLDPYYPGGWNDPLEEGVREGKLAKPYLTATLVEAERRTGLGGGGRYTFGSLDSAAARTEPTWLNATSSNYWGISYDSVRIGSTDVDDPADKYHRMIVDTGTALVLFSETITDKINAQIANSVKLQDDDSEDGAASTSNPWLVPCRTGLPEYEARLPADKRNKPFSITLGGQEFTVPVSRFVFWPLEPRPTMNATVPFEDMCLSAFQPTSAPFAVLGDVFIRGHVVTFDTGVPVPANQTKASAAFSNRRIGVAKRKGEP